MPSLQIQELPDNIYSLLQERAKAEHRSLTQEAIITLAKGLNVHPSAQNRRIELLHRIAENPTISKSIRNLDHIALLREDRKR